MEHEPKRMTFTLKNLLAVMLVIAVLLGLAAPAIQSAREEARRDQCASRLKSIGLALHAHHAVFKRFPALTTQSDPAGSANVWHTAPGATFAPNQPAPNGYTQSPASAAGYSWLVMILPYLDEQKLFDDINAVSQSLSYEAFSASGVGGMPFSPAGNPAAHFATVQLDAFRCPSFRGSGISTASSGTAEPPVTIPAYAGLFNKSGGKANGVAITNYFALSATHLANMAHEPTVRLFPYEQSLFGVIVPGMGLNMKAVLDGTSKTVIACETKEPAVNSWYDGTVCWTVGANPSASNLPTEDKTGYITFSPDTTNAVGLNYGPGGNGLPLFARNGTTPAQTQPVSWGPSSDHIGVVMHLFCDGSVHVLTPEIDPTLYLQLITRAGREPVIIADTAP
jgi:Tfp pilus assembly protein PilE